MARKTPAWLSRLSELVAIASQFGPQKYPIRSLFVLLNSSRLYARLYRILIDSNTSEVNISKGLLGRQVAEGNVKETSRKLFGILLNQLFHLDLARGGHSKFSQRLYALRRRTFQVKVLRTLGSRYVAKSLAIRAYKEAVALEEWSSAIELSLVLRSVAALEGNKEVMLAYDEHYREALKLFIATQEAQYIRDNLQCSAVSAGAAITESREGLTSAIAHLTEILTTADSFTLRFQHLRLSCYLAQLEFKYATVLEYCDQAKALFRDFPVFAYPTNVSEYALKRLVCAVHLRDKMIAEAALEECRNLFAIGTDNWFTFKEYHYLFCMHTLDFEGAFEIVNSVRSDRRFEIQSEFTRQRWELFRLYTEFLTNRRLPASTVQGFLAIVPEYKQDKAGFNLAVLILHIVFLLSHDDRLEASKRIDALKTYRRRYLKGPEHEQADQFVRLLMILEACEFNPRKAEVKGAKLKAEITNSPSKEVIKGVQILPYDWLWTYILKLMARVNHERY